MNNNKKIIIGVLALLVVMTMGYALFSETVNVGGTAKGTGDFGIIFEDVQIIDDTGTKGAKVSISSDKKSLSLTGMQFEYPGAGITVKYKVKNIGSIPALFKRRNMNMTQDELLSLKKIGITADISNILYLEPGEIKEVEFSIFWNLNDKVTITKESINLIYDLVYNQVNSKKEACDKLFDLSNRIEKFEAGLIENMSIEEGDIDGDCLIDAFDSSLIEFFARDIGCTK